MTQYQKLLYEIYGEWLEQFGFKYIKNCWCKISTKGVASFVGTRLLSGGSMEFWICIQPVLSFTSSYFLKTSAGCETPVRLCRPLYLFPLDGRDAFYTHPEMLKKALLQDEHFKQGTSRIIRGILSEHFAKYFSIDMSLSDCYDYFIYTDQIIRQLGQLRRSNVSTRESEEQLDTMLLMHHDYNRCFEIYKEKTERSLYGLLNHSFEEPFERNERKEHIRKIYDILQAGWDLPPMEYFERCRNEGMTVSPSFDEQEYCDRFEEIRAKYTEIMAALKADDHDKILRMLEIRHNEKMETYRKMKIVAPPFSCYFN